MHSVTSFLDFKIITFENFPRGGKAEPRGVDAPPTPLKETLNMVQVKKGSVTQCSAAVVHCNFSVLCL